MNGDLANFFGTPDGFDTHSVEPTTDYTAVPPGKYPIQIEKSEMKATKSENGHFLELVCVILDGPSKGRKLFDRLNLDNPSQQAREIALRQFAALGQALGLAQIADTQQVVGGNCIACVKVKGENNEIRTYEPLPNAGGNPAPPSAIPQQPMRPALAAPVAPVQQPVQAPIQQPAPGYAPDVAGIVPPPVAAPPVAPAVTGPARPWKQPPPQ